MLVCSVAVMSVRRIIQTFHDWQLTGEPMVLATVYDTAGSTYSKPGQRILIRGNADYQGLVSGGCLEGDLAERARSVLDNGDPAAVTYDMRDEADDIFGLGVGCNGMIRVFLQALYKEERYEPFATIAGRLLADQPSSAATVIASGNPGLPAGSTLIWPQSFAAADECVAPAFKELLGGCKDVLASGSSRFDTRDDGLAVVYSLLKPVPRLLVLGAGLDAVPVVSIASELGWRVSVADHRPAYLESKEFTGAECAVLVVPSELARDFSVKDFDAVIVMSHHLRTDQIYLAQLAESAIPYIGVLGPPARKERLLEALGEAGNRLALCLKGPVGLDIGADSPESIALSLISEIHAVLKGAGGRALTGR
jgi:xanthine/CO dehydrogenase XdhC/CoxF family maturation factor